MTVRERSIESSTASTDKDPTETLCALVEEAAHLLPAQGPITAFVHHNTLHQFEDLPFDEAVLRGTRLYHCQPYLPEDEFRRLLARDRIRMEDLRTVLMDDLGDGADGLIGRMGTRYHLRLAMLQHPLRQAATPELRWLVAETEALKRFQPETPPLVRKRMIEETRHWVMRDLRTDAATAGPPGQARMHDLLKRFDVSSLERWNDDTWEAVCLQMLWRTCRDGLKGVPSTVHEPPAPLRHRDLLLRATGQDSDRLVHEVLIRLCAAFLDQGFAGWKLPRREQGLFAAFLHLYGEGRHISGRWLRGLRDECRNLMRMETSPLQSIEQSLELLGVDSAETEEFITQTLLALPGWAGMIRQMELRGADAQRPVPPGSLVEYLAIRLILERQALAHLAGNFVAFTGRLRDLRPRLAAQMPKPASPGLDQRAYHVFQLAQVLGWQPQELQQLTRGDWMTLVGEIEQFSSFERRRTFQLAYEYRFNTTILDAIAAHSARTAPPQGTPSFQMTFCIDDREESFRRHLEEIDSHCQTFGFAGFYAVSMYYRGTDDARDVALCPVNVKPKHFVREEAAYTHEQAHRRRAETRRALGNASRHWQLGSRTFLVGIPTAIFGAFASIPMITRILFPRLASQARKLFGQLVTPAPVTRLRLERTDPEPGPENGQIGYTVDEMAEIVERVLRDIGLTSRFAPLVIVTGHGSSSLNNPHESAYNCGACAGGRGGPNARAFSQMANDPRVRNILASHGLVIPRSTYFVGAFHNTCNENITWFDLDRLPPSHWGQFEKVKSTVDEARRRDAHERCRRFESASLSITPEDALRHVEDRAEDLSQARPEYNHATNAITYVGRRWRTRGLFMDRRVFLTEYDPTQDDANHSILERVLQPAVPVCAGISLEYYFSTVDPDGWGCGSKLPHNVTSLLGVMLGAAGDLRPGLSQQMIEIHEPLRQLFLIEATPEAVLRVMSDNPAIERLCVNEWVYLATLDPHSAKMHVFRDGVFEPYRPGSAELPLVASSVEWYRGWRDHLGPASVSDALCPRPELETRRTA